MQFLNKKHEIRRNTEELNKNSTIGKQIMKIDGAQSDDTEDEIFAVQEKPNYQPTCGACKGPHGLATCEKFRNLTMDEKRTVVDNCRACSSFVRTCRSRKRCTTPGCNRYHHPLLHDETLARILYFEEAGGHPNDQ